MQALKEIGKGLSRWKCQDWQILDERLNDLLKTGDAKKITNLPVVWGPTEEFYQDCKTQEIFVYVRGGEPPSYPMWEKVDPFAKPNPIPYRPETLDEIPVGSRRNADARALFRLTEGMVKAGNAERIINLSDDSGNVDGQGTYRDLHTRSVFRLSYSDDGEQTWSRI